MAQWLDRVKFGSGKNGSPAVSGTINSYATCTGTATQTSLTTALSASLGDVILIHQSQGTGAGQWEINYVLADAGATLTLAYPLAYTYGMGAQAILVPQYTSGTLSGTVTASAWNGTTGGIIALMSSGALTISGTLNVAGLQNARGAGVAGGAGIGFSGGASKSVGATGYAWSGEGTVGASVQQTSANGNGGGGGRVISGGGADVCGGGGGNGTAGTTGSNWGTTTPGAGGSTAGLANLTNMVFGGGGGGAGVDGTGTGISSGAGGAGIIVIFSNTIDTSSATITLNGGSASQTGVTSGGSGAGGSCLIKCKSAVLGTNKITASGGTMLGVGGGLGGVGRIHIDYYSGYTGTTTPTIDATQDLTLTSQVYTSMI